jgi:hypothetical protein
MERIQQLPEEQVANTHLTPQRIGALLKRYRSLNNSDSGEYIVEDFFREFKIPSHHVTVSPQTEATLESLVRPVGVQERQERTAIEKHLADQRQHRKTAREELDKKERITRDIQNEDYMMKKEN